MNPGIRGVPFVAAGSGALAAGCGRGSWAFPLPDSLCRQSPIRQEGALKDPVFYTVHRLKPIDTYTFIAARLLRL